MFKYIKKCMYNNYSQNNAVGKFYHDKENRYQIFILEK